MTGWRRVTFRDDERPEFLIHVLQAGETLAYIGLLDDGRSIWGCYSDHATLARARGMQPEHALTLEPGVIEIYFAPGTYERIAHRLTAIAAEPCDTPKQADVALLVGDEADALRHW
jgi:hypothetical protein